MTWTKDDEIQRLQSLLQQAENKAGVLRMGGMEIRGEFVVEELKSQVQHEQYSDCLGNVGILEAGPPIITAQIRIIDAEVSDVKVD